MPICSNPQQTIYMSAIISFYMFLFSDKSTFKGWHPQVAKLLLSLSHKCVLTICLFAQLKCQKSDKANN